MIATLLLSSILAGQCAGGSCAVPMFAPTPTTAPIVLAQYQPTIPVAPSYRWYAIDHEGLTFQVWGYIDARGGVVWRPDLAANRRNWDAAKAKRDAPKPKPAAKDQADAPKPKPAPAPVAGQSLPDWQTKGVDQSKLAREERVTASGANAQAFIDRFERVRGDHDGLDDDRNKPSLTIIGTEAEAEPILADLRPGGALAEFASETHIQRYERGHWAITQGHEQGGTPDIIVQTPDGTVVWRQQSYQGGAAVLREGLRRANPNYDAKRDPGPGKGSASARASTAVAVGIILLSLVILVYTLMGGEPPHVS